MSEWFPACQPASLPACQPASLPAYQPASLPAYQPACLGSPRCLAGCLAAGLAACPSACLPVSLPVGQVGCLAAAPGRRTGQGAGLCRRSRLGRACDALTAWPESRGRDLSLGRCPCVRKVLQRSGQEGRLPRGDPSGVFPFRPHVPTGPGRLGQAQWLQFHKGLAICTRLSITLRPKPASSNHRHTSNAKDRSGRDLVCISYCLENILDRLRAR